MFIQPSGKSLWKNYKLSIWHQWVFLSPLQRWALNFKVYSGENCFAMKLITLRFSLLNDVCDIFKYKLLHQWSAAWQLKFGKSIYFKIHFTLQKELFFNNWEDFLLLFKCVFYCHCKNKILLDPILCHE